MPRMSGIRIALDLETTGLHAEQDSILEVAAIKFQDDQVLDTFETFISPGRSIPFRIQRLTGIRPDLLTGAPKFQTILPDLRDFLGDYPIVGHSIPFDVGFLRRWGLARQNALIDTFELATVLLPSLASYNLGQVAKALKLDVPIDRHRAMVDTDLAMQVFLSLHKKLQNVDISLLRDFAHLDAPNTWPLLHFFRQELRDRQQKDGVSGSLTRGSLGDRFAAQLGMDPRVLSFAVSNQKPATPLATLEQPETIQAPPVTRYPSLQTAFEQAFEEKHSLLVELSLGKNSYLPLLQTVIDWFQQPENTQKRLVIACAQAQTARKLVDIYLPRLLASAQKPISVTYLAEKGHYLCTHRWFGSALRRTNGELTAEQARGLAKLGLWAQQTLTGERSELTLLPQEHSAWQRISSGSERLPSSSKQAGTTFQRCTYRKKGYCFVQRAEERAKEAQIVITTHAGLFDNLSQPQSLLKQIPHRLLLDTDTLEDEHIRWHSSDLEHTQLLQLLNSLGQELPDDRYQGLLALAAPTLREQGTGGISPTQTVGKAALDNRILSWLQSIRQARNAVDKLFQSFHQLMEEAAQQQASQREKGKHDRQQRSSERLDQPLTLSEQIRQLGAWEDTERAWKQLAQRLQVVMDLARDAEKRILTPNQTSRRTESDTGEESSVASELAGIAYQLGEKKKLLEYAFSFSDQEKIAWLRVPQVPLVPPTHYQRQQEPAPAGPESSAVLHIQTTQPATSLRRLLISDEVTNIFAGTSLSVDSSFNFLLSRLGLENENCETISLSASHQQQTLLCVPNDVPEPNVPQYQRHLDEALVQLASTLEGRTVVLFTSYAALRSSYAIIKPTLEAKGIMVLGQGVDGSPRQLWQIYQDQEKVVLLGAGNFWEGLEELPVSPTCLVVTRLPMPALNDPALAARAGQVSDQLHQFTVPVAALRMRRTLNRLLWNEEKRNALVVFDRRLISKPYGATILHSLPDFTQRDAAVSHMPDMILDWLAESPFSGQA